MAHSQLVKYIHKFHAVIVNKYKFTFLWCKAIWWPYVFVSNEKEYGHNIIFELPKNTWCSTSPPSDKNSQISYYVIISSAKMPLNITKTLLSLVLLLQYIQSSLVKEVISYNQDLLFNINNSLSPSVTKGRCIYSIPTAHSEYWWALLNKANTFFCLWCLSL